MIRINLSPDRKVRRKASKGEQTVAIGAAVVVAAGVLVFLFVHRPAAARIQEQQTANATLRTTNTRITEQTKGLEEMRAAVKASEEQEAAIDRLNAARAVPSWMLFELAQILTTGGSPSITAATQKEMQNNANRRFQESWDPKHVWITSFVEKNGRFKLDGGSRADSDMTQLALRLQASMFFEDVIPEGGKAAKGSTGTNYYTYTITGKVRY